MSQNSRILDVLQDGNPHSVREIHAHAGYSRLNSRVSELRKHGYAIECFHVPGKTGSDGYGYTLVSSPARGDHALSPHLTVDSPAESDAAEPLSSASPEQLSLSVAA